MDTEELSREFERRAVVYERLKEEGLYTLKAGLDGKGFKLHSISSRVKELESFLDKVQRKQLSSPFEEIHDTVGLRVVCLFLPDIERIGDVIRDCFSVLTEDNKIEGAEVSSFGYMSVHFVVTIKKEHTGPRYDHISNLPFEIQVRTILMDAWANVSHYLEYKSEKDVPSDLKRDFYALSGLFYVADKHFEMFYDSRIKSQEKMSELFIEASPQLQAQQEINLDSLTAYIHAKFPERKRANSKTISALVEEFLGIGFKTIGEIDALVDRTQEAFAAFEGAKTTYSDVGVIRISGKIVSEEFIRLNVSRTLGEGVASETLEAEVKRENERFVRFRQLLKD